MSLPIRPVLYVRHAVNRGLILPAGRTMVLWGFGGTWGAGMHRGGVIESNTVAQPRRSSRLKAPTF
jgi:hypothetical protein